MFKWVGDIFSLNYVYFLCFLLFNFYTFLLHCSDTNFTLCVFVLETGQRCVGLFNVVAYTVGNRTHVLQQSFFTRSRWGSVLFFTQIHFWKIFLYPIPFKLWSREVGSVAEQVIVLVLSRFDKVFKNFDILLLSFHTPENKLSFHTCEWENKLSMKFINLIELWNSLTLSMKFIWDGK